jgi:hypothetical protein
VRSIGVAVVVGVTGVPGKDIRVFYPLIVFWSITLPSHHVPEATVVDLCLEDLGDLPPSCLHLSAGWAAHHSKGSQGMGLAS